MMKHYLFFVLWVMLVVFLIAISSTFRNKTEAMVAVVESRVTVISFHRPVVIEDIHVVPGQEVKEGDTIFKVGRPDLTLDIEKKENELQRLKSKAFQAKQTLVGKSALIRIEMDGKVKRLELDLVELNTKQGRQNAVIKRLGTSTETSSSFYDTLTQVKISSIEQEIKATQIYALKELERLEISTQDELELAEKEIELVEKELSALYAEYDQLVKVASSSGIIGTVNVQLDELVQPYTTLVSIYERNPTLIKAYLNEKISYQIQPGDKVEVVSENRLYKIGGTVRELGARVVGYPNKIQPVSEIRSYGQEIFINIPGENSFLNGEKVFVYPIVQE